ncbi:MAG: hypothetical protein GY822_18135 [Deltaproteobacteria bacterium]|nr:hypothetical protein [Deltaproteobacteria bacterium]
MLVLLFAAFLPACPGCDPAVTSDAGTLVPRQDGNGLNVNNASIRSCQVLFTTNGDEVPSVVFDDAVRGEFIPKAPMFSLAFTARDDASLVGVELARFAFDGNAVAPSLTDAKCFDAAGAEVPNALQLSN